MIVLFLAWHTIRISQSVWIPAAAAVMLVAAFAILLPLPFSKIETVGSPAEISEFADWRRVIPPTSNVYVASPHDSASFAWFTLSRPSYLSLDQSAGVIFSRTTALEVQRRSRVLLPLMDEDWKLLSKNQAARSGGTKTAPRWTPLTAKSLVSLCSDPQLGFLIARENVGFDPLPHPHAGLWKDWNLYNCGHVRKLVPIHDATPRHDEAPTDDAAPNHEMPARDAASSHDKVPRRDPSSSHDSMASCAAVSAHNISAAA
jgi:hypothetical protein